MNQSEGVERQEEGVPDAEHEEVNRELLFVPQRRAMVEGFNSLDCVNLEEVFEVRTLKMKTVPAFLTGAHRSALKVILEEINRPRLSGNALAGIRAWKLFVLLPRILLFRPPRGGLIPRPQLEERFSKFNSGQCVTLLECSLEQAVSASRAAPRKRRRGKNQDEENRAATAFHLTQLGELSSARQALEASPVAPGNEATRKILTDNTRRPRELRAELDPVIVSMEPEVPLNLGLDKLQQNLRTSRRGAAGGPSGMTAEHLRLVLDSPSCTAPLGEAASQLTRAKVPAEVLQALRLGRITALQKPDGGIRGKVVSDVFRRFVARTVAQQYAKLAEAATHPFKYALSTRAGTECVTHIVQALTTQDPEATILSIDGIGAYHSRYAMFQGVMDMVDGDKLVPSSDSSMDPLLRTCGKTMTGRTCGKTMPG